MAKFGKIGSAMAGLGMLTVASSPTLAESTKVPTEIPQLSAAIEAVVARFKVCLDEAKNVAGEIENKDIRNIAFGSMVEGCENQKGRGIQIANLDESIANSRQESAAAKDRSAQLTATLIAGAKNELGL